MRELVILGGGTAGSLMANKMVRRLPSDWRVTVVDQDDLHVYQPGLLFVPFGDLQADEIVRPRMRQLDRAVTTVLAGVEKVDADTRTVFLDNGSTLNWDLLVIATGTELRPELTKGLTDPSYWRKDVHEFYSLEGAQALAERLETWRGGTLVVNVADMPIKCPVAPLEFAFLADDWLRKRGLRDATELVFVTPLDGAFTRPVAAARLGSMLEDRGIKLVPNFLLADVAAGSIGAFSGERVDYDLLVTVPLHGGARPIRDSGLGDELGFVPTHPHTLQSKAHDHIFVLGDATDLPISKAGAVAHFQGDVLPENLLRWIDGRELWQGYDGHANCFIETGGGKAMLIDFNYETEPLPGRFPLPGVGPFHLLEESRINHWGKLAFKGVYWNFIVRGEELPLDHAMSLHGKRTA